MTIEWSRLRILDAVARTGSVTRAAKMLNMTGPAVSQQLRRIEAETRTTVVTPQGRGLRLTDTGRVLAVCARRMSELVQQADNELHENHSVVGSIRIGAIASIIRGLLTYVLSSFADRNPHVTVSVEDGETAAHLEQLVSGGLDLVLAESWSAAPLSLPAGIQSTPIARENAFVALPRQHPLGERNVIDLRDLANEVWATCARDSHDHRALVQSARGLGTDLDVRHFVADPVTQKSLIAQNLAVACLPFRECPQDEASIIFRPLAMDLHRDILQLTSDRTKTRALESLTSLLPST
ncbi:LysR family transcriptional regulator [Brevibacterium picturae]|uniref:LysR family transcriptional regulator n=1 Tax=Brevibacterium picturae TaxID=260553 RepID=A0ABP4NCC1_9MICO